ncbi:MAG: bifunctional [glutamate--ammonia ligase]-adenylyl-L-tyrosine phosphorylase/[glutamate--ammonia-ligase] adenylyltransferase [Xanthomonadales bacterium]
MPLVEIAPKDRAAHVRYCSYFADGVLDRYPVWAEGLDEHRPPAAQMLAAEITEAGLNAGLRRFRNRQMLRIVWRDLCGLATLAETFCDLTRLAELCLQTAIDEHGYRLQEKYGKPRAGDGSEQRLFVIGMGKFGGGELNLSSDIDVMFCYPQTGACDGRRKLANDQYFTRLARAVIASLSEVTEDGFCFRVDTRLRPFGNSGPLTSSIAAMEQYYQHEGRDWERYALVKARPVGGDLVSGTQLLAKLRPFIYRRYIDFGSVEALQEMHASVREDAQRKNRMDDIKRGPGGIREIEFLVQCFQILRGGREPSLQTPSLDQALTQIASLELMSPETVSEVRRDYVFLRRLENRIQALRDQQTHRLPPGEDLERITQAMGEKTPDALSNRLSDVRQQVSARFEGIFPSRPALQETERWVGEWRNLQADRQSIDPIALEPGQGPLTTFLRRLDRFVLSQRARRRLDQFMPILLERIDRKALDPETLDRVFDLVLAICRRSAYLVLLVHHVPALDRLLDLFSRSDWIAAKVIRFPALLDELIDPSLGRQIPAEAELTRSVRRLLKAAQGAETVLAGLNYLKLATGLRIAVAQFQGALSEEPAQQALSGLAAAVLQGVLEIAGLEIEARHGRFPVRETAPAQKHHCGDMAIIAYGTLGAAELSYDSDLDIVFLFEGGKKMSDGERPLPAEQYFARLARRVLSYLTIMTPSGRLYKVDTRLRPNGRAGALVSTISAFRNYQLNEAWTWELQALSRARFIAGNPALRARFERIRQEVLCRPRERDKLRLDLMEMREKMSAEHAVNVRTDISRSPKHQPGGLIDIEFIAQFGVLASAGIHPQVLQATATLAQIEQLKSIDWLSQKEAAALRDAVHRLRQQRMMASLLRGEPSTSIDTQSSALIFAQKLGGSPLKT